MFRTLGNLSSIKKVDDMFNLILAVLSKKNTSVIYIFLKLTIKYIKLKKSKLIINEKITPKNF